MCLSTRSAVSESTYACSLQVFIFKSQKTCGTDSGIPAARDGDCYLLRCVLHDWPDESCRIILKNIRKSIGTAKARLALVEVHFYIHCMKGLAS